MQNITFAQAGKPCDLHEALKTDEMGGDKPRDCEDTRSDLPAQNTDGRDSVLHQRHLRVLVVEDDDSTRNVVGALLRNCSYDGMAHSLLFLLFHASNPRDILGMLPATHIGLVDAMFLGLHSLSRNEAVVQRRSFMSNRPTSV